MPQTLLNDALPATIREFLSLFAEQYAELRFPDVDLDTYSQLSEVVRERQRSVDEARAELERRREALKLGQDTLRGRVNQGLAYLRIYAAAHPEQKAALDALALSRAELPAKPRKRRRSKQASLNDAPTLPSSVGGTLAELPLSGAGGLSRPQGEAVRGAA